MKRHKHMASTWAGRRAPEVGCVENFSFMDSESMAMTEYEMLCLKLGGDPERVYRLYFKGDAFVFDHSPTIDVSVAIRRVEKAIRKMKKEYGVK